MFSTIAVFVFTLLKKSFLRERARWWKQAETCLIQPIIQQKTVPISEEAGVLEWSWTRRGSGPGHSCSSVGDSVSLITTAFVTSMSGCCCLASWIAMASAWSHKNTNTQIITSACQP
ncbi:hypothetical protein XENOCAPTIV_014186 [Xenoophorus captivus]|uniref:Uncharacterized protein n=1 Tax=Xenoophorus captivus TaxID=1517983 RepID=A0ABV0Q533_9TELE